eukprot:gene1095-1162_t
MFSTNLHPCSLFRVSNEVFSHTNEDSKYFLCGCYELDESTQSRKGKLLLGEVNDTNTEQSIKPLQEYDCSSGILDLIVRDNIVYMSLSDSTLEVHQIKEDKTIKKITSISKPSEGLYLSVNADYNPDLSSRKLVCSTQQSSVLVYSMSEGGLAEEYAIENAHQLFGENVPIWIANINPHDINQVVSGGDDLQFQFWDTRSSPTSPQMRSKFHQAGVTSLEWFPEHDHLFISGSYDETCAIWDLRAIKRPLMTIETGGGAWRIKRLNAINLSEGKNELFLSVANMQKGSSLYHIDVKEGAVLGEYCYHDKSDNHLNYGLELLSSHMTQDDQQQSMTFNMISCSFYDNSIATWSTSFPLSQ